MAARFAIPRGEAHVWLADPEAGRASAAVLSPAERSRMSRFSSERDGRLYLAAHALLRQALSECAPGMAPAGWRFTATPYGRPELPAPWHDLRFNLSHTHGLVACVVVREADCGIDVERMRDAGLLGAHVLGEAEQRAIRAATPAARGELFLRYWTLKEAYAKARGLGLRLPFDRCVFTVDGRSVAMVGHPDAVDRRGWQFLQYLPTPAHVLAVALRSPTPVRITVYPGGGVTPAARP